MDLFVERIDGRHLRVRGRAVPPEADRGGDRRSRAAEPERLVVRETHHGPIVNEALGADDAEPLALRFAAARLPRRHAGELRHPGPRQRLGAGRRCSAEHAMPVSNLVWADRHGSIGYKTVGRIPKRQGDCPDLPKPGWTGEYEWDGWVPYEELPELTDPDAGFVVTANNRIAPEDYPPPHHERLPRRLPGARIERADRGGRRARPRELRRDADGPATRSRGSRRPAGWFA